MRTWFPIFAHSREPGQRALEGPRRVPVPNFLAPALKRKVVIVVVHEPERMILVYLSSQLQILCGKILTSESDLGVHLLDPDHTVAEFVDGGYARTRYTPR